MLFNKKEKINSSYTIMFPHKQSDYAETYRVKNLQGKTCFLKLIAMTKLHVGQMDAEGRIIEIEIAKQLKHHNLCSFLDEGLIVHNGQQYAYFVTEFVSGETLAQRINRENTLSVYDTKQIAIGVLSALSFLHTRPNPIIHNEVTIQNILLNLVGGLSDLKLIDYGHACFLNDNRKKQELDNLNLFYLAPERLNGVCCVQSDLYAVGVMIYHLIYGELPWFVDISHCSIDKQIERIGKERQKRLRFPDEHLFEMDEQFINTIKKALTEDVDDRFQSAEEFIKALKNEIKIEDINKVQKEKSDKSENISVKCTPAKGEGFAAIAGMTELKEILQTEVIDALHNAEEYARYGLTIPNGMLLYGPPGCGKTFFAKHFAEEVGFNFMLVTPSTLKSRYVNATQENIAKMFKDAEENAPTIIFIDEMNELVPNRDGEVHEMSRSAVNEMLAQMDRTGEKGIFVIGATNYPNMIDPAILRAGRLDKKYYIAPPDKDARKALFELYLKKRPYDFGLDYIHLAELTENYVSADIEKIVNDAARMALKAHSKITMSILEETILKTKPSISLNELKKYARIKAMTEGEQPLEEKKEERPRIGFR